MSIPVAVAPVAPRPVVVAVAARTLSSLDATAIDAAAIRICPSDALNPAAIDISISRLRIHATHLLHPAPIDCALSRLRINAARPFNPASIHLAAPLLNLPLLLRHATSSLGIISLPCRLTLLVLSQLLHPVPIDRPVLCLRINAAHPFDPASIHLVAPLLNLPLLLRHAPPSLRIISLPCRLTLLLLSQLLHPVPIDRPVLRLRIGAAHAFNPASIHLVAPLLNLPLLLRHATSSLRILVLSR